MCEEAAYVYARAFDSSNAELFESYLRYKIFEV